MINNKMKFILLHLLLIFVFNSTYSQTNEISIKFIGNCGMHMTDGTTHFYIDFPYKSGAHHYMEYDKAELDSVKDNSIFIFTHRHSDHYSKKHLRKLSGLKFDPWNIPELEKLGDSIPDFEIKAFETEHKVYGISFKHYSYLITWHGKKIYLSGDTGKTDVIAQQKELDWAFVPAWLAMNAIESGIKLLELTKMLAIYHIGPRDQITSDESVPTIKLLNKQGELIRLEFE